MREIFFPCPDQTTAARFFDEAPPAVFDLGGLDLDLDELKLDLELQVSGQSKVA